MVYRDGSCLRSTLEAIVAGSCFDCDWGLIGAGPDETWRVVCPKCATPGELPAAAPGTRFAIYTRVSTGEQAREGYGLDEQERRGLDHIAREGGIHLRTYTDAGVSGEHASRPELDRLLVAAKADEFDALVCYSLDRLGRSTKNLLELYERLEDAGVSLVFLRERLDTSTSVGRLLRTLLSAIAEFERELIIGRVTDMIAARARTAKPWGEPAYGYGRGQDGHWTTNPEEQPNVERIFDLYVNDGLSYNAIAAKLTRDSIPTRRGSKWTATVVKRILSHPAAIGQYVHQGEVYDGSDHPRVPRRLPRLAWSAARSTRRGARAGSRSATCSYAVTAAAEAAGTCSTARRCSRAAVRARKMSTSVARTSWTRPRARSRPSPGRPWTRWRCPCSSGSLSTSRRQGQRLPLAETRRSRSSRFRPTVPLVRSQR
jgi:DNA invertase Pin-like site-specific DNA recombinase